MGVSILGVYLATGLPQEIPISAGYAGSLGTIVKAEASVNDSDASH